MIDEATAVAARGLSPHPGARAEPRGLEQSAQAAFGQREAGTLLAILKPTDPADPLADCTCSTLPGRFPAGRPSAGLGSRHRLSPPSTASIVSKISTTLMTQTPSS